MFFVQLVNTISGGPEAGNAHLQGNVLDQNEPLRGEAWAGQWAPPIENNLLFFAATSAR
ncbi:hypothetical protein [Mesorhizobium sp.]|uniref:hypothetical protein n=1 Tax=Mesorhizobium sp. TaxID=1871066 RepID=UPI0025C3DC35|nr:hypothetical protein [Mesorhizobium sp.]